MATSTRINITIDQELKLKASNLASEMGLSFSGLVGLLLSKTINKDLSGVEKGLLNYLEGDVKKVSADDFQKELKIMIKK